MNSADVIAYTHEGGVYCPDCLTESDWDDETGVWFADDESGLVGSTCGDCQSFYTPDNGWTGSEAVSDYRWSRCERCNAQRPYARSDSDARLRALRGQLTCDGCNGAVHFGARS
jgi:hypothetical protein